MDPVSANTKNVTVAAAKPKRVAAVAQKNVVETSVATIDYHTKKHVALTP